MNAGEIAVLRSKLREINIEYSALVRKKAAEDRIARMKELEVIRRPLMALIAEVRGSETNRAAAGPFRSGM